MPTRFDLRAVLYEPGGDRQRIIAAESLTDTAPIDDPSVLGASVSALTFQELPDIAEVAVEYFDGAEWHEAPDARYLVTANDNDDTDVARVHDLSGTQMVHWLLSKAIVEMPDGGPPELNANGTRPFNSATPGAIVKTLLDEAQLLGWAPFLTYDFDADDDSNGDPWAVQLTIGYRPGTTALLVVKNLLSQGLIEFRTEGRLVRMFNAGAGADYATAPVDPEDAWAPVRVGRQSNASPIRRSIDDLLTDAVLYGDDGFTHAVNNPSAPSTLGRLVAAVQQGGVSDEGTAELLVQAQLDRGSEVRHQYRVSENAELAAALPWVHYQVGDWVQAWIAGEWQRVRVAEVVVQKLANGTCEVTAILNDRFLDALARLAKRTVGIVGGAVAGGTGAVPSEPGDDTRAPKAPTGLVVDAIGYWSNNNPLAAVAAEWAEVTQGADDVAIEVAGYELWGRLDDGADESDVQTSTDTTRATWSPYEPLTTWRFKVRAISATGTPGPFSAEVVVVMPQPSVLITAPPTPPQLSSSNGLVLVGWDGLLDTTPYSNPPAHFRQVNVEFSGEEAGTYSRAGTLFIGNQRANYAGLGVGSIIWYRFRWVDNLGRESDPSDAVSITVAGINGADLVAGTVTANSLVVGSITVDYLEAGLSEQIELSATTIVLHAGQIADLQDGLDATDADLADLRLYVVIDGAELRLTRPGSDNAVAMDNERIAMRQSGVDVSWWEGLVFFAPNLVTTVAQIGPMQFSADPEGTGLVVRPL